jgi:hypothetical protein
MGESYRSKGCQPELIERRSVMANEQNLIPNSERTPSELREQTRKAGIASGKARKRKADLRRMAQDVLDGTYIDKNTGEQITGEELVLNGIVANLDPNSKNWGKAMDLLVQLLGAGKSREEKQMLKAQTALIKAKAELLTVSDEGKNGKLAELIEGLKEDDIYSEATPPDGAVADESPGTN